MLRAIGVLVLSFASALPALAGQSRASFVVSVRILPRAVLPVVEQAGRVELSADDVERGYKQVAVHYRVSGTGPRGYLLQVARRTGLARRIEVDGLGGGLALGDIPLEIHRPAEGCVAAACTDDFALVLHVVLDADARPGSYPLPVQLAALPL
jgi:hypothetical protein